MGSPENISGTVLLKAEPPIPEPNHPVHGVPYRGKDHVNAIKRALEDHECVSCPETITIFNLIADPNPEKLHKKLVKRAWRETQRAKKGEKAKSSAALLQKRRQIREKGLWEDKPHKELPFHFPPAVPSRKLRHEVISGMCDELDPASLEESGCAVCGIQWRQKIIAAIVWAHFLTESLQIKCHHER
ncbi:hypothetical protein B0H13DRAFT_1622247 [Mycena leptocephala]|nr:hypothetical protein B0H13DRAFT_1622247 [Mycena leptocephala]